MILSKTIVAKRLRLKEIALYGLINLLSIDRVHFSNDLEFYSISMPENAFSVKKFEIHF